MGVQIPWSKTTLPPTVQRQEPKVVPLPQLAKDNSEEIDDDTTADVEENIVPDELAPEYDVSSLFGYLLYKKKPASSPMSNKGTREEDILLSPSKN